MTMYRSGHVPKRPAPPAQNSSRETIGPNSHFKVSNVNKIAIFYGIVLIPQCMLFLAMYTFVIVTMRLYGQRNTSPK